MSSSGQQSKNVAQAMENEKAKLDELMKNAKNHLQRKEVVAALADEKIKAMAVCEITSKLQSEYYISHSYIGDFMTTIPKFVTVADGATFVHQGSMGAIIYALRPEDPLSPAWLLAWSKPELSFVPSKVYVSCGQMKAYMKHDTLWKGIEVMLHHAKDFHQDYDPVTGAVIMATIKNTNDIVGSVGATLSIMVPN